MKEVITVKLDNFLSSVSAVADLVAKKLSGHHLRVAYASYKIGERYGLTDEKLARLIIAALIHDIGALSLTERLNALNFDLEDNSHARIGYRLLKMLPSFEDIATFIKYHHEDYISEEKRKKIPEESFIIHIADRAMALIPEKNNRILNSTAEITAKIKGAKKKFPPELIEVFEEVASKESFWLDLISPEVSQQMLPDLKECEIKFDREGFRKFSVFLSHIIDFRSRFTAAHSAGVAIVASNLAELSGFKKSECLEMKIAGYLHDIGKLAVPTNILEKNGKLTKEEFNIIKTHTYFTYRSLEHIKGLKKINRWASYHHERVNGKGYPFKVSGKDLDKGARLMIIADMFTALTEDRPYRNPMKKEKAVHLFKNMQSAGIIDEKPTNLLVQNYDLLFDKSRQIHKKAVANYDKIFKNLK